MSPAAGQSTACFAHYLGVSILQGNLDMNLNELILEVKEREEYGDSTEDILEFTKSIFSEDSDEYQSIKEAFSSIPEDHNFEDNSVESEGGNKVYFRNIEEKLISEINDADVVIGAIAWLYSENVINALAEKDNVFLIVDKNPLFNINTSNLKGYQIIKRGDLLRKYKELKCNLVPYQFDNLLNKVSEECSPFIDPIKCAGIEKSRKSYATMHNKFLLFAKMKSENIEVGGKVYQIDLVKPYSVWTGSFNFTPNASRSLENALVITDEEIVRAYYKEFGQLAAISEKLEWESSNPNPDWKFT